MSTSFVEETSHTRIDLHCRQNDLKVQIQQLINNYGKDSVERRHRDGFYSGKLTQFNNFWQQFWDLDEEVQQAASAGGDEYASGIAELKELVEKYQQVFKDYMVSASGAQMVPQ